MMHPSPEEVRAEAEYRGHAWASRRRVFAVGTNRAPVRRCGWCGAFLDWISKVRWGMGVRVETTGICGPCRAHHSPEAP